MPLFKGKPCSLIKLAQKYTNSSYDEIKVYTIEHTQEQFLNKAEYEKRLAHYVEPVWTCQCTGAVNLTHREATESEQKARALLKEEFPESFEKFVLQIVHHNTNSLELLVDEAYRKLHESFQMGEKVTLKAPARGKVIRGAIAKIDRATASETKLEVPTSDDSESPKKSPPKLLPFLYGVKIDGEGKIINGIPAADLQRELKVPKKDHIKLFVRANALRASTHPNSPWVVDARLVKKYELRGKFADFLMSPGKANGKENALTPSKKRKLTDTPVDGHTSPAAKRSKLDSSLNGKSKNNLHKKKNSLPSADKPVAASSKLVSPKKSSKTPSSSPAKKALWPGKTSQKTSKKDERQSQSKDKDEEDILNLSDDDSASDEEHTPLAILKNKLESEKTTSPKSKPSDDEKPKKNSKSEQLSGGKEKRSSSGKEQNKSSSKIKKSEMLGEKSPLDKGTAQVTLYRLASTNETKKKYSNSKVVTPSSPSPSKEHQMMMKQVTLYQLVGANKKSKSDQKTPTKNKTPTKDRDSPRYSLVKTPSKKDDNSPKYSLVKKTPSKSVTKDDESPRYMLAKKTPNKSPSAKAKNSTPRKPVQPVIVQRLLKVNREENKLVHAQLVSRCARELSKQQIDALPLSLINVVTPKYEAYQEKLKIERMNPEERDAYLLKKKEEAKIRSRELMKKKWAESKKRFEDTDLELKPLPSPKIVPTPDGFVNELFGDVVMVTEFMQCYKGLLMPEEKFFITPDQLMQALVSGKDGFPYITRILSILLQTLLQDQLAEEYKELRVPLSQLPVNEYTCTELVRLCLRKRDATDDDTSSQTSSDSESIDAACYDEVVEYSTIRIQSEAVIDELMSNDFIDLKMEDKLQILVGLCYRVMGTYSIQDFIDQKQQDAAELWRKRIAFGKEKNDKLKLTKEEKKKLKLEQKLEKKDCVQKPESSQIVAQGLTINNFYGAVESEPNADDDVISLIKKRHQNAAKIAEERKQKEEERRIQKEKEIVEARLQKEKEAFEKQFKTGISLSKRVFRQTPVGFDRDHGRYWLFSSSRTGLYIEKGWAPSDIDYCVHTGTSSNTVDSDSDSEDSSDNESQAGGDDRKISSAEKTWPRKGQNLWFILDSLADIDNLISALHPMGVRESFLKTELQKNRDDIVRMFTSSAAKQEAIKDDRKKYENKEIDFIEGFREELLDTEQKLRKGGLGGVPDFDLWEAKLLTAKEIPDFVACLIETKNHILEKFLSGMMAAVKVKTPCDSEDSANEPDKADQKEIDRQNGTAAWLEALQQCTTFSRLHVLLGILDSCIIWEKSVENVKCRICRKKGNEDDHLLLCDECNLPFHLYCLRPAVTVIPTGDWFCSGCTTEKAGRRSRVPRVMYNAGASEGSEEENTEEEEDDEDEGIADIEHDEECMMCGLKDEDNLVPCTTCSSVFHMDCHDPPLRHFPRANTWKCIQCKTGKRFKRATRLSSQNVNRKRKQNIVSDNSETEDDDNDENRRRPAKRSSFNRRTQPTQRKPNSANSRNARAAKRTSGKNYKESSSEAESTEVEEEEEEPARDKRGGKEKKPSTIKEIIPTNKTNGSVASSKSRNSRGESSDDDKLTMLNIIGRLMKHRNSWPFQEPVDADEVPDYYELIKNPMDLSTMEKKCVSDMYSTSRQFAGDFALMLKNAEQYNLANSDVSKCIEPFEKYFESLVSHYLPKCSYVSPFASVNTSSGRQR